MMVYYAEFLDIILHLVFRKNEMFWILDVPFSGKGWGHADPVGAVRYNYSQLMDFN
jgi:hypothetical protein